MIIELYKKDISNIGDYYCNPSRYFNFDSCESNDLNDDIDVTDKNLIIGGGGLLYDSCNRQILKAINQKFKVSVLWGAGINCTPATYRKGVTFLYPDYIKDFSLIGVRDYHKDYTDHYLPCVSCMHDAFTLNYEIKNPTVFYLHRSKTKDTEILKNLPVMYNDEKNIYDVINFLGSSEKIITNSYHGAYWGMLLNKEVEIIPWSIKFDFFKNPPKVFEQINEPKEKNKYQDFLEESKNLNVNFYKKTIERFNE
jgi:hypothetical protein